MAKRIKIILRAAEDTDNCKISRELEINRATVKKWRKRWYENSSKLIEAKEQNLTDKKITEIIIEILSDEERPGTPSIFTPEEIVQIVGIALEKPENSGLPITHWSTTTIAQEAEKRGIVKSISERSVGRFLKMKQI